MAACVVFAMSIVAVCPDVAVDVATDVAACCTEEVNAAFVDV
jgi:hypothetical protein